MELVPYENAVEYITGHKTREEMEEEMGCSYEEYCQRLFDQKLSEEIDDEELRSLDVTGEE